MEKEHFLNFIFALQKLEFNFKNIFKFKFLNLEIKFGKELSERIITFGLTSEIRNLEIFGVVNDVVNDFQDVECLYVDNIFEFKIKLFRVI